MHEDKRIVTVLLDNLMCVHITQCFHRPKQMDCDAAANKLQKATRRQHYCVFVVTSSVCYQCC